MIFNLAQTDGSGPKQSFVHGPNQKIDLVNQSIRKIVAMPYFEIAHVFIDDQCVMEANPEIY